MRATAFGLDLEAAFEMPGFDEAAEPTGRRVELEIADLPRAEGERIAEARGPDGAAVATVDALSEGGYRLWAEGFGSAHLGAEGAEVRCSTPDVPAWRWQRFLSGQVLPFVAVLRGLEGFHASAVVLDGRALAVVGGTGAGKTSLALELALRGPAFLNDDVLVVERRSSGVVVAHPGPGLANVRRDGSGLAERLERTGLGRCLGETADETRMALRRHGAPVRLAAVYFLERHESARDVTIERLAPLDPRLLLASTFNLALRGPDRLTRQLDVCAAIAATTSVYRVACPPSVDAAALAELLHEEARRSRRRSTPRSRAGGTRPGA